jgi:Flp pilus assembly protein TadB
VDLSGIIFVALAIGWAVYLIPKALQREDEKALSRSVDTFSDSMRILGRRTPAPTESVADQGERPARPRTTAPQYRLSRPAARDAARRRRRVLGVLLGLLLVSVATSTFSVTPWWSTAVPGGLVVLFLLVARLAVRAQQVRRFTEDLEEASGPIAGLPLRAPLSEAEMQPDLEAEDTVSVTREELAAAVAAPTTDAGGLWDPLPITLPTYVNKPRARRTVRTIELTQAGVTSSGHDAADTALARRAAADDAAEKQESAEDEGGRKVVGG